MCCNYKLNTLTDVPYQMTVGGAFVYVCERDLNNGRVYITRSVITRFFPRGPRRPRYNGVAVYLPSLISFKLVHSCQNVTKGSSWLVIQETFHLQSNMNTRRPQEIICSTTSFELQSQHHCVFNPYSVVSTQGKHLHVSGILL